MCPNYNLFALLCVQAAVNPLSASTKEIFSIDIPSVKKYLQSSGERPTRRRAFQFSTCRVQIQERIQTRNMRGLSVDFIVRWLSSCGTPGYFFHIIEATGNYMVDIVINKSLIQRHCIPFPTVRDIHLN